MRRKSKYETKIAAHSELAVRPVPVPEPAAGHGMGGRGGRLSRWAGRIGHTYGGRYDYAGVVPNADSDNQETWGSDNETVAKVDEEGIITAVAEGTTTITHTYYEEKEEVAEPAAPVEGDDEPDSKSNAETSFAESDAEHVEEPVEDLNGDAGDTTVNSAGEVSLRRNQRSGATLMQTPPRAPMTPWRMSPRLTMQPLWSMSKRQRL